MLNLFIDFVPIVLFFVAFKVYGIYAATIVGIVVTALLVIINALRTKRFEKIQLVMLSIFIILGGMTLYFHDPIFIKWKPTIVYWIFSSALLISHFVGKKPLVQRAFELKLEKNDATVPFVVWRRLNLVWATCFATLGVVNLYVAYHFSTEIWVNFKLYGTLGFFLVFAILQVLYLTRYISDTSTK